MNRVYLNKKYLNKETASISIMDRGFLFGDSVYEVIPFFDGKAVGLDQHLARLNNSSEMIQLPQVHTREQWHKIISELVTTNSLKEQSFSIYIQVSRGSYNSRRHVHNQEIKPTVLAFCAPITTLDPLEPHKAILLEDTRHGLCAVKNTNLLSNTRLKQTAELQGAIEAILHSDNQITECTSSNVFIVTNNTVITPPLEQNILAGITRGIILAIAKTKNHPCIESNISITDIQQADEIWITSSTKQILPITYLNDKPVGNGTVGPIWKIFNTYYKEYKQATNTTMGINNEQ
jgi:D-alanine transaminase